MLNAISPPIVPDKAAADNIKITVTKGSLKNNILEIRVPVTFAAKQPNT